MFTVSLLPHSAEILRKFVKPFDVEFMKITSFKWYLDNFPPRRIELYEMKFSPKNFCLALNVLSGSYTESFSWIESECNSICINVGHLM